MANFYEAIMVAALDVAVFLMIGELLRNSAARNIRTRFTAIAFGIGFLLGIIGHVLADGSLIVLMLFALGFMLSYTAFVFSVPDKREKR